MDERTDTTSAPSSLGDGGLMFCMGNEDMMGSVGRGLDNSSL